MTQEEKDAGRAICYATSLAIDLLRQLDIARAQLACLKSGEDGRMIDIPGNALSLSSAVTSAQLAVREIKKRAIK